MVYEYALEPEMVATWGTQQNYRFFMREFGLGRGRIVSRCPKSWYKKVLNHFDSAGQRARIDGARQSERSRLVELLNSLKETMIKRKDCKWDEAQMSWVENALLEHGRHPFRAILARNNPNGHREIICERDIGNHQRPDWNTPNGIIVNRDVGKMVDAVKTMLACCSWVRFVDPHISPGKTNYRRSLQAFLGILGNERPVGPPKTVEIHTHEHRATREFLKNEYAELIPINMTITLFQWKERRGGQSLHNRYLLTNLGGVLFGHGLDTGKNGEVDDLNRLEQEQFRFHNEQYNHVLKLLTKLQSRLKS